MSRRNEICYNMRMKIRLVKIIFIAAISLVLLKTGVSAAIYFWPQPTAGGTVEIGNDAALELIQLTNAYRRGLGLNELAVNPRLTQAAINKAKNLLAEQYFSHTSPSGKKFSDWIKEVNYAYFYVGENLAIDFANPQEVFDAWLASPKHKENIEREEFQEIGIADVQGQFDGRETNVVVQLFGSRVLGENELSASSSDLPLAKNYFSAAASGLSAYDYFGLIDRQLNYILFFVVLLLAAAVIIKKIRNKKTPVQKDGQLNESIDFNSSKFKRISASKQAPPLVSLYTKQILTANGRSRISENTSQPDSRKSAKTKTPKPEPTD